MTKFLVNAMATLLVAAAACVAPGGASAQDDFSPKRTVSLIVPYAAGGALDALARLTAEKLSKRLGQSVVVENISGANGNIGMGTGAKAAPDGYRLTMVTPSLATNSLMGATPYELSDFAPIAQIARFAEVLVVNPASGITDLRSFVEQVKSGKVGFYASGGKGSAPHFAMAGLEQAIGKQLTGVPFRGEAPVVTAVLGNEVPAGFITPFTAQPQVEAGKLRAIAVSTRQRSQFLPGVPSISETYPEYEYSGWFGIVGPKGLPKNVVDTYAKAIADVYRDPEVLKKVLELRLEPSVSSADEMARGMKADQAKYAELAKAMSLSGN
jgi:tripartite-type tricarboxylate transporter receptor subunit TctC